VVTAPAEPRWSDLAHVLSQRPVARCLEAEHPETEEAL
jgi:hypothetical protein